MPKEACEITVPKTSKQKSGIHVKIDIAKNLELTKYFFLNILICNSNNHDNLICIHRKKRQHLCKGGFNAVFLATGEHLLNTEYSHWFY